MGHVKTKVKIVNSADQSLANKGYISPDEIRMVETEALVDTGATGLNLPISIIDKLGLVKAGEKEIRTANGIVNRGLYRDARVTILNRSCPSDITELPDDCPALIGVTILEELDLVPNTSTETLEPNPAHGGKWVSYAY